MTAIDAVGLAVPAYRQRPAPPAGDGAFHGAAGTFARILIRGGLLMIVTLGIYRFWLTTDIRRFLWSNTEVAGDRLEYIGTARELLLGFLIALAVLVPIYGGIFLLSFGSPAAAKIVSSMSFLVLLVFGQFAVYRARRYRLTRTIFRGLRLHQTGSGFVYALLWMLWWVLIILTLGLAYPWAQAGLERYKMRHTFYGNLQGRFAGSGTRLFVRGILMWLAVVPPLILGISFVAVNAPNWGTIAQMGAKGPMSGVVALMVLGAFWSALAVILLYPVFQAMLLRWWLDGLRFGDVAVTSRLRTSTVYGIYLRFLAYALLLALVGLIVTALVGGIVWRTFIGYGTVNEHQLLAGGLGMGLYVVAALAFSTIYQTTVKLGIWRLAFETLDLAGTAALDSVQAVNQPSSAVGEGIADALNVGGF